MTLTPRVGWKRFFSDIKTEIKEDNVSNGAAALAYYLTLAFFPTLLVLLTLMPYLPIQNLQQAIMDFVRQALPAQSAELVSQIVRQVTGQKQGGLLSVGIVATIWAASNGFYAMMQQMNVTYDVREERSFIKARGMALLMMLLFGVLVLGAFALIIFGGQIESWLGSTLGWSQALQAVFRVFRWVVLLVMMALGFEIIFYLGPNVKRRFEWISLASVFATVLLSVASLAFSFYVNNFGNYSATYGSIGAVIILMLWFYITGWVLLLGAEMNALNESYEGRSPEKAKMRERHQKGYGEPIHQT